jgi:hypothetical protein
MRPQKPISHPYAEGLAYLIIGILAALLLIHPSNTQGDRVSTDRGLVVGVGR